MSKEETTFLSTELPAFEYGIGYQARLIRFDELGLAVSQVGIVLLGGAIELLAEVWDYHIVAVDEGDVLALSCLDTYVACWARAHIVWRGKEAELLVARVYLGTGQCNQHAVVVAMVVDEQHLDVIHGLSDERGDAGLYIGTCIVYGDDDRYFGCIQHTSL